MNIPAKPWTKKILQKKFLPFGLQAMGDVVATLPYLQYLINSLPASTKLDFLNRKRNRKHSRKYYSV